jgi:SpoVK/Ycf46/Vps4 family AAA+-type ATPase
MYLINKKYNFTFSLLLFFSIVNSSETSKTSIINSAEISNTEEQQTFETDKRISEKIYTLQHGIINCFNGIVQFIDTQEEITKKHFSENISIILNCINLVIKDNNNKNNIVDFYNEFISFYKKFFVFYGDFNCSSSINLDCINIQLLNNEEKIDNIINNVKKILNDFKRFILWIDSKNIVLESNQKSTDAISTIIQSLCLLLQKAIVVTPKYCTLPINYKLKNIGLNYTNKNKKIIQEYAEKNISQVQYLLQAIQNLYNDLNVISINSEEFQKFIESSCHQIIISLAYLEELYNNNFFQVPTQKKIEERYRLINDYIASNGGMSYEQYLIGIQKYIEDLSMKYKTFHISYITKTYRMGYSSLYDFNKSYPFINSIASFILNPMFLFIGGTAASTNSYLQLDKKEEKWNYSWYQGYGEVCLGLFSKFVGMFEGTIANTNNTIDTGEHSAKKYKQILTEKLKSEYTFIERFPYLFYPGISLLLGTVLYYPISKFDETTKISTQIKELLYKLHTYMVADDSTGENNNIDNKERHCEYNLNDKTFNHLRKKGLLDWFDDIIQKIKNPSLAIDSTSRVICIEGPSGCGKTTLAQAFAQTILDIPGKNSNSVAFAAFDPNSLYKKDPKSTEPDIFESIEMMLTSIRNIEGKIIVIYLDEFHLFFTDKSGNPDHKKVASFLKLFANLKQKQKGTPYGIYIVTSTNKPEYLPHEFFDNPDRIATRIVINYPSFEERIELIETTLKKYGVPLNSIDVRYISGIMENENVAQGWIILTIQKAMSIAKRKHELLKTKHIYEAYNLMCRKIIQENGDYSNNFKEYIASYYCSQAIGCMLFNKYRDFDAVTLYAINERLEPKEIKDIYKRPDRKDLRFGKLFMRSFSRDLKLSSIDMMIQKIIPLLMGTAYVKINEIPIIDQSTEDNKTIVKEVKEFVNSLYSNKLIVEYDEKIKDQIVHEKYKQIMSLLIEFTNTLCKKDNTIFNTSIDELKKVLLEKDFVSIDDIKNNKIIQENISEMKQLINNSLSKLKQDISIIIK